MEDFNKLFPEEPLVQGVNTSSTNTDKNESVEDGGKVELVVEEEGGRREGGKSEMAEVGEWNWNEAFTVLFQGLSGVDKYTE
ncbi:hypothetical protein AQUCO_00400535v1 [Aquilegia coerulea]|uniref:Uncharacterized protein n=1 Tax=Aquilegia coerulea TaxID=218851 RepID=A0A2G5EVD3_AQUCA|nr:hypothetical protein AQUCO_00400535v1 [Aquilegia coerulea]